MKTFIFVLLAITGFGLVGFGFYWLWSTIQNQNAIEQAQLSTLESQVGQQGGLGGAINGILGFLGL